MANPNVVGVSSIYGKTVTKAATTSYVTLLAGASDKLLKVNTILAANKNTSANKHVSMTYNDGSTVVNIAEEIAVPAKATLVLIDKSTSLYMDNGHIIQVKGQSTDIEFTISYEEIDDA